MDADVKGEESIFISLTHVKGIDFMLANAICAVLNLDRAGKIGFLSESDIEKIEDCMQNPGKYGIPNWMFNRRKDLETGVDKHIVGATVKLQQGLDIRFHRRIKDIRGIKHSKGKKVRGQRTRTTGRKGGIVGVIRKKEEPKKAAPATAEKKK